MASATTAESSASMPARNAIVNADGNMCCTNASDMTGRCGAGIPVGIDGKRSPTVATGRCSSITASVAARSANRNAGSCGAKRRNSTMMASVPAPTHSVGKRSVPSAPKYAVHLPMKSAGTLPASSPRKSPTWLEAMMTAMPAVNPVTTGMGIKRINRPSPA